ncbi:MAG: vWA domain-containing protein [Gaiellaceae bacterium]
MSSALHFLTPEAVYAAPVVLVPAAAVLLSSRRRRKLLALLGLAPAPLVRRAGTALAAAAACALLVAAAAQPVLARSPVRNVRTDSELYVVLDTSRSMAASATPTAPTREARAKRFAIELRSALPEIPAGAASFTDQVLPHLVPTSDAAAFDSTIAQAIGVNRPPPSEPVPLATSYTVLSQLPGSGGFAPHTARRLLVLLTDGESQPYTAAEVAQSLRSARTGLLVVRFWRRNERVFVRGVSAGYVPTPSSTAPLAALGRLSAGGRVYGEHDAPAAARAARSFFGSGPSRGVAGRRESLPLAPWLTLAALLPLGLVLGRHGGGPRAPRTAASARALLHRAAAPRLR